MNPGPWACLESTLLLSYSLSTLLMSSACPVFHGTGLCLTCIQWMWHLRRLNHLHSPESWCQVLSPAWMQTCSCSAGPCVTYIGATSENQGPALGERSRQWQAMFDELLLHITHSKYLMPTVPPRVYTTGKPRSFCYYRLGEWAPHTALQESVSII